MSWLLSFILLMLSGSPGLLAGIFNDRIDGVRKPVIPLPLLMIPISLGTITQLGGAPMRLRMLRVLQTVVGYQSTGFTALLLFLTTSYFVGISLGSACLLNKHCEIKHVSTQPISKNMFNEVNLKHVLTALTERYTGSIMTKEGASAKIEREERGMKRVENFVSE